MSAPCPVNSNTKYFISALSRGGPIHRLANEYGSWLRLHHVVTRPSAASSGSGLGSQARSRHVLHGRRVPVFHLEQSGDRPLQGVLALASWPTDGGPRRRNV